MTKKKLIAIVCSGTLLFLIAALFINFMICMELSARKFFDNIRIPMNTLSNFAHEYKIDEDHKSIAKSSGMSDISVFMQNYIESPETPFWYYDYPLIVKAFDEEGNEYEAYRNYIKVNLEQEVGYVYINLDDYLNEEQIEKLCSSLHDHYYPQISSVKLGHDGEKYVLNEMTIDTNFDDKLTFTFSSEKTVVESDYPPAIYLHEIKQKSYDKIYYAKLEEEIQQSYKRNNDFNNNGASGQFDSNEGFSRHHVEIDGKPYIIFFASKYNLPLRALTSNDFKTFSIIIVFTICLTGIVFLYLALKIFKKNEQLENSKRTFISAAAHELKTPIAVIQNQCECILENVVPEKNDEYLKSIYDEALRMNDIVTSLLSFNRLSLTEKIEKETCDFSAIVNSEVEKYRTFAQSEDAEISLDIKENVFINCNCELMTLAVDNLLSNAVKYTTGEKKINVSLTETKGQFCLEIFNTCDSLSEDVSINLWDIFEVNDTSRTRNGNSTGMGLPICKRIFDLHEYIGNYMLEENGVVFSISGKQ